LAHDKYNYHYFLLKGPAMKHLLSSWKNLLEAQDSFERWGSRVLELSRLLAEDPAYAHIASPEEKFFLEQLHKTVYRCLSSLPKNPSTNLI